MMNLLFKLYFTVLIASLIWDFYEVPKPDEKQMAKINTTKKFDMVT